GTRGRTPARARRSSSWRASGPGSPGALHVCLHCKIAPPMIPLAALALFAFADGSAGFFAASREAQTKAERAFLETPAPERARRWLFGLTEEPHLAGAAQE